MAKNSEYAERYPGAGRHVENAQADIFEAVTSGQSLRKVADILCNAVGRNRSGSIVSDLSGSVGVSP